MMDGISPFLVILFLSSVTLASMGIMIRIDSIKHERNLAQIDRDYWKKMYELEKSKSVQYPTNL